MHTFLTPDGVIKLLSQPDRHTALPPESPNVRMEGLPANLSERDFRAHSRLAPVVRRLWCGAVNYCNGSYGPVKVGALQAKLSPIVRSGLLTTNSTDASGWQPGTVRCWRLHILPVIEALHELGFRKPDRPLSIFNFGVFMGDSLYFYRRHFPDAWMTSFDSFEGLPSESPGELQRATWVRGTFHVDENQVMSRLTADGFGGSRQNRLVKGFFNESLTPSLARELRAADIVDVDSDIYVSAYQALDWVFTHGLARRGTLVVYDDFMDYTCAAKLEKSSFDGTDWQAAANAMNIGLYNGGGRTSELWKARHAAVQAGNFPGLFEGGEPKAHREIAAKHGVRFMCLAGSCAPARSNCDPHHAFGAIFVVLSVGGGGQGTHGVRMTERDLSTFRQTDQGCSFVSRTRFTLSGEVHANGDGSGDRLTEAAIALRHRHRTITDWSRISEGRRRTRSPRLATAA